MTHQITIEQRLIEHKGNSIDRDNLALAKIRAQQDEITRLRAENKALKALLTLYDGQESTQDAPLGMTGVIADMAAEIKSLRAALTSSSMSELQRLGQEYDAAQVACVKPLFDPWQSNLAYVLQDELQNRLIPRVSDIAYTAFMRAKEANDDDGGPTDWPTDTKPLVMKGVEKIRKAIAEDLSAITIRSEADVWNEAVEACAKFLQKQSVEKGSTKTPQGRTANFYRRKIRALKRETGE